MSYLSSKAKFKPNDNLNSIKKDNFSQRSFKDIPLYAFGQTEPSTLLLGEGGWVQLCQSLTSSAFRLCLLRLPKCCEEKNTESRLQLLPGNPFCTVFHSIDVGSGIMSIHLLFFPHWQGLCTGSLHLLHSTTSFWPGPHFCKAFSAFANKVIQSWEISSNT